MSRERIDELYAIISNAETELQTIRSQCKHDQGYFICLYGDTRMSIPQKLCNTCDSPMGDPSEEEYKEFELREQEKTREQLKKTGLSEDEISDLMVK